MKPHYLIFLSVLLLFSFTGCTDDCDELDYDTFFEGTFDGENLKGDGVAFIRPDSVLHIRLLAGEVDLYRQINILVDDNFSGSYNIERGDASTSEVIELDVLSNIQTSILPSTDKVELNWNEEAGYIEGEFQFSVTGIVDGPTFVGGAFRVQVGNSQDPWQCGFLKNEPDSDCCRFINN